MKRKQIFDILENTAGVLGAGSTTETVVAGFLSKGAVWIRNTENSINYYNLDDSAIFFTEDFERYRHDIMTTFQSLVYYIYEEDMNEKISDILMGKFVEADVVCGITNEGERLEATKENIKKKLKDLLVLTIQIGSNKSEVNE